MRDNYRTYNPKEVVVSFGDTEVKDWESVVINTPSNNRKFVLQNTNFTKEYLEDSELTLTVGEDEYRVTELVELSSSEFELTGKLEEKE